MTDFIEYVLSELKSKRLSRDHATSLLRQFTGHSPGAGNMGYLHPLLHQNTSDLDGQRFRCRFHGREFFLADHRVQGASLMPGVAYLEMVRVALAHSLPDECKEAVLEIRDTVWLQPFFPGGDEFLSIDLFEDGNHHLRFAIYSDHAEQETVHCQGLIDFPEQVASTKLHIMELQQRMKGAKRDAPTVYNAFARAGLQYGKSHQGIVSLWCDETEALAHIQLPEHLDFEFDKYILHPALMDSSLQAAIGLQSDFSTTIAKPYAPFALHSLRLISPCPKEIFAWVRYSDRGQQHETANLDIDIVDGDGNICIEIRGFMARELQLNTTPTIAAVNRNRVEPGLHVLAPVWSSIVADDHQGRAAAEPSAVLLLGGNPEQLAWVKAGYGNVQQLDIPPTATIADLQALFAEMDCDQLLWLAPDLAYAEAKTLDADLIEQQNQGVWVIYRMVKALLQLNRQHSKLKWTFITANTLRVNQQQSVSPAHAGVAGLIGSLAKEFSQWQFTALDIESLSGVTARDCLLQTANPQGNSLAFRQGEWCRQSLAVVDFPQQQRQAYKQGGVYVVIGGAGGVGRAWSRYLIEHYQAKMVWIGRRPLNHDIELKIQALAALGPAPRYFSADARSYSDLKRVYQQILKIYPAINGVVHSAIVLHDQSFAQMDELNFRHSLQAKVDTSVNMDKVFGQHELDFMLFFSSMGAFFKSAGQSNYAAGCTFKDSFAHSLQQQRNFPVKMINWGYWGDTGIVSDRFYRERMREQGIGSLALEEGMATLQVLLTSEFNQLGLFKTLTAQAVNDLALRDSIRVYSAVDQLPGWPKLSKKFAGNYAINAVAPGVLPDQVVTSATAILAATLRSLGAFSKANPAPSSWTAAPLYTRWLLSSGKYLQQQHLLNNSGVFIDGTKNLSDAWCDWENDKQQWLAKPNLRAQIRLLETCLKSLPDILTGKLAATDVIFPGSSMELVEGIYRDNALADFYNQVMAEVLLAAIEQRVALDSQCKIRILEIGAGTGGTTKHLLPILQRYANHIAEYCYTDMSQAFLMHAEQHFRPEFPALTTAICDISKPLNGQSIRCNHYDLVVAANVLHATANIRETLRNTKAALRHRGMLLLNEVSTWALFGHLTFGLLEGWWLHQDSPLRIAGSAGLAPEQWQRILQEEGFDSVFFPAPKAHEFGQQIIVASSDGYVRQQLLNSSPLADLNLAEQQSPLAGTDSPSLLREQSIVYFRQLIAKTFKFQVQQIDPSKSLSEYGLDSILVVRLTDLLRETFTEITTTLLFELQSINGLVDYFIANYPQQLSTLINASNQPLAPAEKVVAPQERAPVIDARKRRRRQIDDAEKSNLAQSAVDVAVIGLSGRYPGADNLNDFWRNLKEGKNCATEIPEQRWDWREFYSEHLGQPGKINSKWGGFLSDIDQFDPLFFHLAPVEAERMDPQERLFLQTGYHAIEDAGYIPEKLDPNARVGVFVGVMNARYSPQPNYFCIANRLSWLFDFQGPSLAVDTACSSSLTAIHLALQSLYSGTCNCAIAGGVNLIIDPVHFLELSKLNMLTSGNKTKAFGASGDGFVDAEGVGAVVLKPLASAKRDGDHIYGVIKGSAINAGGKTHGYTVPNPRAQADLIFDALRVAKLSPDQLSYIEAHGTGTSLGDPIEIAGLTRAFRAAQTSRDNVTEDQLCPVGSVKSNIGHCESAAGIAGLTKVLLQLKHRQLVPSLYAETTNPEIRFAQTPFKVQTTLQPWLRPQRLVHGQVQEIPRVAGISSFGAGGANAHLIVAEYSDQTAAINQPQQNVIVPLSARTSEQLRQKVRDLLALLHQVATSTAEPPLTINALAFTLQTGRAAMAERLGFIVDSLAQLQEKLQAYLDGEREGDQCFRGRADPLQEGINIIGQDDDMQLVLARWIASAKFTKLLDLWVKGVDVDWHKLYDQQPPQRVSLPTYPFAKERYWHIATDSKVSRSPVAAKTVLHPLLHTNNSTLLQQSYCSTFTGDEFFLRDHRLSVNGQREQKILPAVVYLEMVRAAMDAGLPLPLGTHRLSLNNTVWLQPLIISEPTSVHVALSINSRDSVDFEIYCNPDQGDKIVYCRGEVSRVAQPVCPSLDIAELRSLMQQTERDPQQLYHRFAEMGIHDGSSLQAITAIATGDRQLLASLAIPEPALAQQRDYELHPSIMDAALQACAVLYDGTEDIGPALPFALQTLTILAPCQPQMLAWVRLVADKPAGPNQSVALDISLCDRQGNLCVLIEGLTARPLGETAQETISTLLVTPQWLEKPAIGPAKTTVQQRVMLCGFPDINVDQLQAQLHASHLQRVLISEGQSIADYYREVALICFSQIKPLITNLSAGEVSFKIAIEDNRELGVLRGIQGLLNSAMSENPHFRAQLLLISPTVTLGDMAKYLQEALPANYCPLVKYGENNRQVLQWQSQRIEGRAVQWSFKDNGVYVITGGLGGLGMQFGLEILKQSQHSRVILVGRSELDEGKLHPVSELGVDAQRWVYRRLDVTNTEQVDQFIKSIVREYQQLNGIIHCAGITADNLIPNKTTYDFEQVMDPKVIGTWNLDVASRDIKLDFFVLFSSLASVIGNPGQADYATANGFMDGFAYYRNSLVAEGSRTGQSLAINWPLWRSGGMQIDQETQRLLQTQMGLYPLDLAQGMRGFYHSVHADGDQVMILAGVAHRLQTSVLERLNHPQYDTNRPDSTAVNDNIGEVGELLEFAQHYLCGELAKVLKLSVNQVDAKSPLENYGFDSLLAMKLTQKLELTFGPLSKTLFFEYQTMADLAKYFADNHASGLRNLFDPQSVTPNYLPEVAYHYDAIQQPVSSSAAQRFYPVRTATEPKTRDLAIIGMAGRFPQAENLDLFWSNLQKGKDCVTEIPPERWDSNRYFDRERKQPGKSYSKWGGFIADVDKFDPLFFNMSPKEAALIDPQERLFLETAWQTIEDAGYSKPSIAGARVGVYVGVMWGQYQLYGADHSTPVDAGIPSSSFASIANRVSWLFDFHGPSIALDTMCSSSLTAIHLAREAILSGEIDVAIAGGVNLSIHPQKYLGLSQGNFVASDGRCRSFGEGGDGYVPGEGVGAVLLKSLDAAVTDGDQIHAVIKSSAINHGGKTNGYTVPNPSAQSDVITRSLRVAGIAASTLSYLETHGTGTALGDPIEITSLVNSFATDGNGSGPNQYQYCPIGSVKSNIGHLESAAGIAALAKTVLQLKNRALVPSLHAERLNPNISFAQTPFYVQREFSAWPAPKSYPRRAGLSSFGAGGANAHLVIEEYVERRERVITTGTKELFLLSARDLSGLQRYAANIKEFLSDRAEQALADFAYTSQVGRTPMPERLAIVADSVQGLQEKLALWLAESRPSVTRNGKLEGVFFNSSVNTKHNPIDDLMDGSAGKQFLQTVITNGDLSKLAKLWVSGIDIDWTALRRNTRPLRVSLPTYPFAREPCWINSFPTISTISTLSDNSVPQQVVPENQMMHYRPCWQERALGITADKLAIQGPIMIMGATDQWFLPLQAQLREIAPQADIYRVEFTDQYCRTNDHSYGVNPTQEVDFQHLATQLNATHRLPGLIIHCRNEMHSSAANYNRPGDVSEQLIAGVYSLFYLSKALLKVKSAEPLRLISVCTHASATTVPDHDALGAFLKTLVLEQPCYAAALVQFNGGWESNSQSVERAVRFILDEISAISSHVNEVRYQFHDSDHRYTRKLRYVVPCEGSATWLAETPLKHQGVYLITGGLGGVGYILSQFLAKEFTANLIITGRSALGAEQQHKILQLEKSANRVLYIQADISQWRDTQTVMVQLKEHFSTLNGVFHCAGQTADSYLLRKTSSEFAQVLNAKVYGTVNLDQATADEDLDIFMLFSSLASITGSVGQCDYAYGNRFMDAWAEYRDHLRSTGKRCGQSLAINWPYWESGGMALTQSDIALAAEQTGLQPLPSTQALRYLQDFLKSGLQQGVAAYGDPTKIAHFMATPDNTVTPETVENHHTDLAISRNQLHQQTEAYLKNIFSRELKLAVDRIDSAQRFEHYGIDSVIINQINSTLEVDLGPQPKTLLYQYETIDELSEYLLTTATERLLRLFSQPQAQDSAEPKKQFRAVTPQHSADLTSLPTTVTQCAEEPIGRKSTADREPIAIIGLHGSFPQSENLDEFWENLKQGKDLTELVPSERWHFQDYYDPDPERAMQGKIYCKWGGFLRDVDKFDPAFFNISDDEATAMDPQERLFLGSVWAAIENAGYTRASLKQQYPKGKSAAVGVYVGVTTNSYNLLAMAPQAQRNTVSPSALPWSIANRVSYFFDFQGPSMPVDTACSSSLVAIHMACASLQQEDCQIAIAGGVNLYLHPSKYQSLCQKRMVAKTGKNCSFGAGDDGFVPGEGVGCVVLKPLGKALQDHDHIHGVILASHFNHSGRSNGYSAPNPNSQAELLGQTLTTAGLSPESISYVEGHGTGTQLGDSLEVAALTAAFSKYTAKQQFCALGSVKSNIGHAESAAGMAALSKVILQMKYGELAPSIHGETPNPNIDFAHSPFYLQTGAARWPVSDDQPRRAMINAFGAGGVNASLIVEEFNQPGTRIPPRENTPHLFLLSARSADRLHTYAAAMLKYLQGHKNIDIQDMCYTLQVGREPMSERLAVVVSGTVDLINDLGHWLQGESSPKVYRGRDLSEQKSNLNSLAAVAGIENSNEVDRLHTLAKYWCAGNSVDWQLFYRQSNPARLPLPTYPFEKIHYWAAGQALSRGNKDSDARAAQLHPLVYSNSSTLETVRFLSLLADDDYYAVDHIVHGEKILPGSAFIEIACICGVIASEKKIHRVRDMVWLNPLNLTSGGQSIQTFLQSIGNSTEFEIVTVDPDNERVVHAEGKLTFKEHEHGETAEVFSIEELKSRCSRVVNKVACYELFDNIGFHYGPSFRVIQEFYGGNGIALAELQMQDHLLDDFDQYILHPSIVDGALQAVIGLVMNSDLDRPYLPFAVDEIEVVKTIPPHCYAFVELAELEAKVNQDFKKFNIKILNKRGEPLLKLNGLYLRALAGNGVVPQPKADTLISLDR